MYLRYKFTIYNGEITGTTQYPWYTDHGILRAFLITESVPLLNVDDGFHVRYIIPDILFDENIEPWSRRITPPRVPPYLVCVETIIEVGKRQHGINIVCEGDYVGRIVNVFCEDDVVRIGPTPYFLDHVRTWGHAALRCLSLIAAEIWSTTSSIRSIAVRLRAMVNSVPRWSVRLMG